MPSDGESAAKGGDAIDECPNGVESMEGLNCLQYPIQDPASSTMYKWGSTLRGHLVPAVVVCKDVVLASAFGVFPSN